MIVDCATYDQGERQQAEPEEIEGIRDRRPSDDAFVWVGLVEPTKEEFEAVRREFELHELAVEDAINAHQRPKLEQYGDTLFLVLKTVDVPQPRGDRGHRRGDALRRRGLPHHRPARRGRRARPGPGAPGAAARSPEARAGRGDVRDRRPRRRRVRARGRGDRRGHRGGRGRGLLPRSGQPGPAHLQAAARGARLLPRRRAAPPRARTALVGRAADRPGEDPRLLPGRHRPPDPRDRAARLLPRAPLRHAPGEPDPGERAPERGHAPHLGVGRDHRRPHRDRRDLRHELRAHAGARLAPRLPGRPRC